MGLLIAVLTASHPSPPLEIILRSIGYRCVQSTVKLQPMPTATITAPLKRLKAKYRLEMMPIFVNHPGAADINIQPKSPKLTHGPHTPGSRSGHRRVGRTV